MREQVVALALAVSGAGEPAQALLEALCGAAESYWTGRLREGVTAEDCLESFCCAAAFTAAASLAAGQGGGVSSCAAGEGSVKGLGGAESAARAKALERAAERLMEPYAAADGFCFRGVRA